MWNLSAYRLTGVFRKSLWLINLLSVVCVTGLVVEVAPALRQCRGGSGCGSMPIYWRRAQSAPPPGEAGQAAGGTRRQLRWVVGGTLLAVADRLP